MTFLRILLSLSMIGMLSSCDMGKEKNTAPKPPPAPKAKPKTIIKPQETEKEAKQVLTQEPRVAEWEGGQFAVKKTFPEADLVLVLFYADWCEHCNSISPLLEGITNKEDQKIRLLRVNADLFPELSLENKVEAVPKILIFNSKGKQIGEFVGSISEGKLNTIIRNVSSTEVSVTQP